jgi:hypothetical protein
MVFDPDEVGKEIRIQKRMGVLPGTARLCEKCGTPTPFYITTERELDPDGNRATVETRGEDEIVWDRFCRRCAK